MNARRLAIVLPDMRLGGAERVALSVARELRSGTGCEIDFVLLRAEGELLSDARATGRVVNLGASRLRGGLSPLRHYFISQKPDAALVEMWPLTTVALWARALSRVPTRVIVSDHTDYLVAPEGASRFRRFKLRQSMRWSYPMAEGVVAVSDGVADTIAGFSGLAREKMAVIYNPVDGPASGDAVTPPVAAMSWAAHVGPRIIAVGSLKPAKDYGTLLRAFAKLHAMDARLLILGEGPLRDELEALRRSLGLETTVEMPGFVPNPYPYLMRANLFVLSSAWEGFGNVIVEALASGTPVVSTDCRSGPREILAEGRFGRLVPVGNADELAASIRASLSMRFDAQALIARSKEFSIDKAARAYQTLLLPDEGAA